MHEIRFNKLQAEVRKDGDVPTFQGAAVVYDAWSDLLYDHFNERMRPGCFDKFMQSKPDIICCIDHNSERLLGRTGAGTLNLRFDERGVHVSCPSNGTTYANDLQRLIERSDINGMSFTFDCLKDKWHRDNGVMKRDVEEAALYEVSFVTSPAYPQTDASVRSNVLRRMPIEARDKKVGDYVSIDGVQCKITEINSGYAICEPVGVIQKKLSSLRNRLRLAEAWDGRRNLAAYEAAMQNIANEYGVPYKNVYACAEKAYSKYVNEYKPDVACIKAVDYAEQQAMAGRLK